MNRFGTLRFGTLLMVLPLVGCGARTAFDDLPVDDAALGDGAVDASTDSTFDTGLADTGIPGEDAVVVEDISFPDAIVSDSAVPPPFDSGVPPTDSAVPPTDSGVPPTDSGVPPTDTGVDSGPKPITCGSATCDSATQECCVATGGPGGATASCKTKGTCSGGVTLSCSSGAACPTGQVCCLTIGTTGGSAKCASTCGSGPTPGGGGSARLCTSDAECPTGQRCQPIGLGIRACLPSGPGGGPGGGPGTPPPLPDAGFGG